MPALRNTFTDRAGAALAAVALVLAPASTAIAQNVEAEQVNLSSAALSNIQPGQRVTEAEARSLSQTAGIVFFCADDRVSRINCSDTAAVLDRPATWVTGYSRSGNAKLLACGQGGETEYEVANSRGTAVMGATARRAYDALSERGDCAGAQLASAPSSPDLES